MTFNRRLMTSRSMPDANRPVRMHLRGGFTLVECLVTLVLMAIVLPTVMGGVSAITHFASDTKRYSDAAQLAAAKLGDIMAAKNFQVGSQSGDFSDQNMADYQWQSVVSPWQPNATNVNQTQANVYQIDVTVTWTSGAVKRSLALHSLGYNGDNPASPYNTSTGGGAAPAAAPGSPAGGASGGR